MHTVCHANLELAVRWLHRFVRIATMKLPTVVTFVWQNDISITLLRYQYDVIGFTVTNTVELLEHWWLVYHGCFKLILESLGKKPIATDLG